MSIHYLHRRRTIGVLIGWHVYWTPTPYSYLTPIFRGINAAVNHFGCNLLLACGMGSQTDQYEPTHPAWPMISRDVDFVPVSPWNTDGLIVINPLISEPRSQYVHGLLESGFPVVFIAKGEGQPLIVADNEEGVFQAVSHLAGHGHRDIVFIAGNEEDKLGDSGDRLQAFQSAVQKLRLNNNPDLISYGRHTFQGGFHAVQNILKSGTKFTALLASNDESAMGAMQAVKDAGLKIPEDIAIIGFDGRPESVAQVPPLTTIHVPLFNSGYQAVEVLLEHIDKKPEATRMLKIPTRLAIRQSCGCRQDAGVVVDLARKPGLENQQATIIESIKRAVLSETQWFQANVVNDLCEQLVGAFIKSLEDRNQLPFQKAVDELLERADAEDDDAHIWQAAISSLRQSAPALMETLQRQELTERVGEMLDEARNVISERMRRQHGRHTFAQKWMLNRIGSLTARLLLTSDSSQILDVLSEDLPAMGIQRASLSFFDPEKDDPVAWSMLHAVPRDQGIPIRYSTRRFPPPELYPPNERFSLILLPLVSPVGPTGFISYDLIDIELAGPITQQISAALNNAHLYKDANDGRKLAEEADSLKSRFLSMVSHELRTPLNLIAGLSEILLQSQGPNEPALPGTYRKDLEQIYSSAQHLGRLIGDVLDLASSQVGQLRLSNELLDLGETLEMVAATGQQLTAEKGLNWRASLSTERVWVWGDRTRLRQVALNLVSNAVKFTAQGQVSLKLQTKGGKAVVEVSDTGMGIAPEEQKLIFDEFQRSKHAHGYGGMGLGLAISKRLVEMHGGEIGIISSGQPGAGTTFYFSLSLIEPKSVHDGSKVLPLKSDDAVLLLTSQSGSSGRLLEHLVEQGHQVKVVDVNQAEQNWLSTLSDSSFGAVVLDMAVMPTQGWHILHILKENQSTRNIPLLFYSLTNDKGAMLDLDYLVKPVAIAELAHALEYHKLDSNENKAEKVFLIVDDDPATLAMHVRMVQSQPGMHRVLRARNGREALQIMQEQRPDLVLLDLMMPELDGFGVLEAMREKESTREIPVVVLTGQILTEKEMARLNRGVVTVLGKGLFSVEETLSHIDAALARKRKLGNETQRLVRRAMAYLHEHYTEPVSRDDLARHLGMNGDYLTYCFRTEVGMAPIAYLNRYRVNQAKELLTEREMSITEVALAVGFSDSSYFGRVFRRQVGVSPETYRKT